MSNNIEKKTAEWLGKRFKVPATEFLWYNGGVCYSRVLVKTREAAEKVSGAVKKEGRTANGGWFHGMPLGGIEKSSFNGEEAWDVTC